MIQVIIAVKDEFRTRSEVIDLDELGPEELARVDDLLHETRDYLERLARARAANAKYKAHVNAYQLDKTDEA